MEVSVNLTNPSGHAEQVSLGAEYGSQASNVYTLALTKPRPGGRPLLADVRLHQLGHSHQAASSYVELVRGGALTLSRWVRSGWRRVGGRGAGMLHGAPPLRQVGPLTGGANALRMRRRSEDGRHAVSYELGWRRLSDPARSASRAVVGQLGDRLLSAVKYVWREDTFDHPTFPTQGACSERRATPHAAAHAFRRSLHQG